MSNTHAHQSIAITLNKIIIPLIFSNSFPIHLLTRHEIPSSSERLKTLDGSAHSTRYDLIGSKLWLGLKDPLCFFIVILRVKTFQQFYLCFIYRFIVFCTILGLYYLFIDAYHHDRILQLPHNCAVAGLKGYRSSIKLLS